MSAVIDNLDARFPVQPQPFIDNEIIGLTRLARTLQIDTSGIASFLLRRATEGWYISHTSMQNMTIKGIRESSDTQLIQIYLRGLLNNSAIPRANVINILGGISLAIIDAYKEKIPVDDENQVLTGYILLFRWGGKDIGSEPADHDLTINVDDAIAYAVHAMGLLAGHPHLTMRAMQAIPIALRSVPESEFPFYGPPSFPLKAGIQLLVDKSPTPELADKLRAEVHRMYQGKGATE